MRRRLFLAALMMVSAGCASAVYDSLERRGVDAKAVLEGRVRDAREDALAAAAKIDAAAMALGAATSLDGPALARQVDAARAGAQDAAVAAQEVRLSADTVGASGARFFREWEEEIALYETAAEREAAATRLKAQGEAHKRLVGALGAANLRLSPALSLLNEEVAALRKNPTSGVVAKSRAGRIDAAAKAAGDASAALRDAAAEADRFLAKLK